MKVLIYMELSQLRPVGGPLGYVNNLKELILKEHNADVEFLVGEKNYRKWKSIFKIDNWKIFPKFAKFIKLLAKFYLLIYGKEHSAIINLNDYDMVHFHSTLDMYSCRDSLDSFKGKAILTSHSPTLLSKEVYDSLRWYDKFFGYFVYKKLFRMDDYSFNRADYFIFPCKEAEEPYYHSWSGFKQIREEKASRFYYLPTGINPCIAKENRQSIREKYGIPENAFLICYVGRHNAIKGYDILKQIGNQFLEKHSDSYVIVAGKEDPMKMPNLSNWIEVGWTNDPHSIIAASDVFVLPNRETYFDLIMLEVLSLGKIVVASKTGGNKYFVNCDSVKLYDTLDDAAMMLEGLYSLGSSEKTILELKSKELFEKKFTCENFYNNYKYILSQIYGS